MNSPYKGVKIHPIVEVERSQAFLEKEELDSSFGPGKYVYLDTTLPRSPEPNISSTIQSGHPPVEESPPPVSLGKLATFRRSSTLPELGEYEASAHVDWAKQMEEVRGECQEKNTQVAVHEVAHAARPSTVKRAATACANCRETVFRPWSEKGRSLTLGFGSGKTRFEHQTYKDSDGSSVLLGTLNRTPMAKRKKVIKINGREKWRGAPQLRALARMTTEERDLELSKLTKANKAEILNEMLELNQNTRGAALASMTEEGRQEALGGMSPSMFYKTFTSYKAPCGKIRAMKGLGEWPEIHDKIVRHDPYNIWGHEWVEKYDGGGETPWVYRGPGKPTRTEPPPGFTEAQDAELGHMDYQAEAGFWAGMVQGASRSNTPVPSRPPSPERPNSVPTAQDVMSIHTRAYGRVNAGDFSRPSSPE